MQQGFMYTAVGDRGESFLRAKSSLKKYNFETDE